MKILACYVYYNIPVCGNKGKVKYMGKVKVHEIDEKEKYKIIWDFFGLVFDLKSKKEVVDFLVGLMTASEILMMARRIQIARMLLEDKSCIEIRNKLKVGNDTILRTDNWLNGRGGDYKSWIKKCIEKLDEQKKNGNKKDFYFESMLDKYPNYRLWKNLIGKSK